MTTNEQNDDALSAALAPFYSTFSIPQLESVLYAYLPTQIVKRVPKTGVYTVDTFVVTATVTFILVVARLTLLLVATLLKRVRQRHGTDLATKGDIAIVVEPTSSQDDYHTSKFTYQDEALVNNSLGLLHAHYSRDTIAPNIFHQALSHLVSQSVQSKANGYYTLKPNLEADHAPLEPPAFNIVPQTGQVHSVTYKESTIYIALQTPPSMPTMSNDKPTAISTEPSIRVSVIGSKDHRATVASLTTFINDVAQDYISYMDSLRRQTRSRYDYSASGKWVRVCSLYENQGLQTVALCPKSEAMIAKDLDSFVQNKNFYKRIGAPYVRGYLLYGRPGTGKTSLVFAIASYLKRHLYFMNLSYIDSDSELFQAFASVPANSIVAFEDIDTMTTILHRRTGRERALHATGAEKRQDQQQYRFNLSTFLSILDGHTLEEGIIFVMTTNHPEILDPAVTRPGRMDIHLDLTFATHYQMRQMYRMVLDDDDQSTLDEVYPKLEQEVPEFLIPPSEIMQTMVLCREHTNDIPGKLQHLTQKYQKRGSPITNEDTKDNRKLLVDIDN